MGAEVSVIPATRLDKTIESDIKLYAANGTRIATCDRRLIDIETGIGAGGKLELASIIGISTINKDEPYAPILKQFPEVFGTTIHKASAKHDVVHFISTTGPSVHERPRRLTTNILKKAREEYQFMIDQGICRPCSSPWASALHMVPKKDGD
ncbi:uncharacterized protein [Chelonus insularis]|uniref:uncharacterized protein n=1 Tax=Chelonus insularis TaxID=460826 RepID=UPI00158AF675|nr:uncharacterized protein LOC118068448 [Chelonus insularis]